jgi:hypothetical protein
VSLGNVHTRILIAGAWLLGVTTATGGSLWAVSKLGQGFIGQSSQQLTVAAVNRALASEATDTPSAAPDRPGAVAQPAPSTRAGASLAPDPSPSRMTSSSAGTLLTSGGGDVVAGCASAGAYLLSWSPQQSYEASYVVRGPAAAAKVVFQSGQAAVTMVVTCRGGVPSAVTSVDQSWHGDD